MKVCLWHIINNVAKRHIHLTFVISSRGSFNNGLLSRQTLTWTPQPSQIYIIPFLGKFHFFGKLFLEIFPMFRLRRKSGSRLSIILNNNVVGTLCFAFLINPP